MVGKPRAAKREQQRGEVGTPLSAASITDGKEVAEKELDRQFEKLFDEYARRAAFKIDIHLTQIYRRWRGLLMIQRCSSHYDETTENFAGMGDEGMMWCVLCDGLIGPEQIHIDTAFCPTCMRAGKIGQQFADHIKYDFDSPRKLAKLVHRELVKVQFDADIYLRRYKASLLEAIKERNEHGHTPRYHRLLAKSRQNREPVVYERRRLERDLSTESSAITRLTSLLSA